MKIRSSSQRRERFARQCDVLNIKVLELLPDVKTRWNSTFIMMQRALQLREVRFNLKYFKYNYITYTFNTIIYFY